MRPKWIILYNKFYFKKYPDAKKKLDNLTEKDFFDVLYFILDGYYKQEIGKEKCHDRVESFFINQYWRIGHCIRNFISIIKFVHDKKDVAQKEFYIAILRDMATIDELRLLFYATIWKGNNEGKGWKRIFDQYQIFNFIGNDSTDKQLIERDFDLQAYDNIK